MSAKENFNKAMFDMFGVGNDPEGKEIPLETIAAEVPAAEKITVVGKAEPFVPKPAPIPVTYLAPGVVMEGRMEAKGDVEIAGQFKGDIKTTGKVTIHSSICGNIIASSLCILDCALTGDIRVDGKVEVNEKSVVTGNIFAKEIACSGAVKGDLEISGHATFNSSAKVEGNITTSTMTMDRGAVISGSLIMKQGK